MSCPTRDELERLGTGVEDPDIRKHVAACSTCSQAIERLREDDALAARVRRALGGSPPADPVRTDLPGGFELLRLVGKGGQGEVYEAVQLSTGRKVALKLCLRGRMATPAQRSRFLREVQLAAQLAHPGLVTIFEAGTAGDGTPYCAMELVRGERWDAWADQARVPGDLPSVNRLLAAFEALCAAVGHAHEQGIVHRDLKPANILVDAEDGVHVLDLGIARRLDSASGSAAALQTQTGEIVGSLGWMAPEGLGGRTTPLCATDVYSLGLLLHRAVSGRHAYPLGTSITEIVRGVESLPDSLRPPFSGHGRVDADLLGVLTRALEREPGARYADAENLRADIRRLIDGERPHATRPARRTRWLVPLLLVAATLGWLGLGDIREARAAASVSRAFLAARDLAESDGRAAHEALWEALLRGDRPEVIGPWMPPEPASPRIDRWRLACAHVQRQYPYRGTLVKPSKAWNRLATSSSGSRLAVATANGPVGLHGGGEDGTCTELEVLRGEESLSAIFLSADGQFLTALAELDGATRARCYRLEPDLQASMRFDRPVFNHAPSNQEAWFATFEPEPGLISVRRLDDDTPVRRFSWTAAEPPLALAFTCDDRGLVVTPRSGPLLLADIEQGGYRELSGVQGTNRSRLLEQGLFLQLPLPDGQLLSGTGQVPEIVDPIRGSEVRLAQFMNRALFTTAPGGPLVAGVLQAVRGWRPAHGFSGSQGWSEVLHFELDAPVQALGLRTHGQQLAVLTTGGSVTSWDMETAGLPSALPTGTRETVMDIEVLQDGRWVACAGTTLLIGGPEGLASQAVGSEWVYSLAVEQVGNRVFLGTLGGRVGVLDLGGNAPVRWIGRLEGEISALDVSPDGRLICAADLRGTLAFLDIERGEEVARLPSNGHRIADVRWTQDGLSVVGAVTDGGLVWSRPDGTLVRRETGQGPTRAVAVNPRSFEVVSGHDGARLMVSGTDRSSPPESLVLHGEEVNSIWALDFSPDGEFLAIGCGSRVSIWDWRARRELFGASAHEGRVFAVRFHPVRPVLASAGELGDLLEWDFGTIDGVVAAALESHLLTAPGRPHERVLERLRALAREP